MTSTHEQSNLTIGIIGFGSIGRKHLATAQEIAGDIRFIVLSKHSDPAEIAALGATHVLSIEPMLAANPDIVIVSTDAATHHVYLKKLLRSNARVFIEKPLAATAGLAKEIVKIGKSFKDQPLVTYNLRFSRALECVRDVLARHKIGMVQSVQVVVGQALEHWRPDRDLKSTVSVSRAKGGGVLRELSHEFDLLHYLFGPPATVTGLVGCQRFDDFDVDDTAVLSLCYADRSRSILASVTMDFTRWDLTRSITMIGSSGTLSWDMVAGLVCFKRRNGDMDTLFEDSADISETRRRMWSCILKEDDRIFCDLETGHNHLCLIEKVESMQSAIADLGRMT